MHRLILGVLSGTKPFIDHADHDTLNNRRLNLRICPPNGNVGNMRKPSHGLASRFKGVSSTKKPGQWRAYIKVKRRQVGLGTFATEDEAARRYDAAALVVFGEFAMLNLQHTMPSPLEIEDARRHIEMRINP